LHCRAKISIPLSKICGEDGLHLLSLCQCGHDKTKCDEAGQPGGITSHTSTLDQTLARPQFLWPIPLRAPVPAADVLKQSAVPGRRLLQQPPNNSAIILAVKEAL